MAILREDQLSSFSGFHGFGAAEFNVSYCDKKFPRGQSEQIDTWNKKCKTGCTGLECVSKPGLIADPWTIVGKQARGLPDDSVIGTALALVKSVGGGGSSSAPAPSAPMPSGAAPSMMTSASNFLTSPMGIALGGVAVVGLALALKARRGKR